jgi:hypothetical protein
MNDIPLHGFEPPEPPPGLREAALRAARTRFAEAPAPDIWTRVLRSRAARFAWAASVVVLAAAHLAVPRSREEGRPDVTVTAPHLEPEIRAIAKLPRIDDRAYAAFTGERS